MKLEFGYIQLVHQFVIIVAISSRFGRFAFVSEYKEILVHYFLQRLYHFHHIPCHRYLSNRIFRFWRANNQLGIPFLPFDNINSFNCLSDINNSCIHINIIPGQSTYLAYSKSRTQTNIDTKILKRKVFIEKLFKNELK